MVYSNHCNKSGYYNDYVSPFPHVDNCAGASWTNVSECGGSYHVNNGGLTWNNVNACGQAVFVDNSVCYQNVSFVNDTHDLHHTNTPGTAPWTNDCQFGNSCAWTGNACVFGNSCAWTGNACVHGDTPWANWPNCAWDANCVYGIPCGHTQGGYYCGYCNSCGSTHNQTIQSHIDNPCASRGWGNSCGSGYSNSCASRGWGDACGTGYSNSCSSRGWGNACGSGYSNSCYYYANHSNVPFNNFCNHSNTY